MYLVVFLLTTFGVCLSFRILKLNILLGVTSSSSYLCSFGLGLFYFLWFEFGHLFIF